MFVAMNAAAGVGLKKMIGFRHVIAIAQVRLARWAVNPGVAGVRRNCDEIWKWRATRPGKILVKRIRIHHTFE
jgi:hypothetical protein